MPPVTIWSPTTGGELSDGGQYDIVTQSGVFIVDQLGNTLVTGISVYTPKPATIWNDIAPPTGTIMDEMSLDILDESGDYIEDESSVPYQDNGSIPETLWTPTREGEMTIGTQLVFETQLGIIIVDQNGNNLVTGTSVFTPTPTTEWLTDQNM